MLFDKYKPVIDNAVSANHLRKFFAQYPEHPKAYGEEEPKKGLDNFNAKLNKPYEYLLQEKSSSMGGEEISPYWQKPLGINYPLYNAEELVNRSHKAMEQWRKVSVYDRAGILMDSLERISGRFFELAYATMHTSGQSFMMSFQASGPHSNDRALEAIAMGYFELTRFPEKVSWEKPMGKFTVTLEKTYHAVPKGIAVAIGCSTFPVWNSVPGIYASLITGNTVIVKPHPKAVYPIAIIVEELQKTFRDSELDPHIIQLAADTSDNLITKELAEHPAVKLIDYTGNTSFGDYLESLKGKTIFTEKTGVNSVIIDSCHSMDAMMQNLTFAAVLYSGQMCTAPQNFFIPETGITADDKHYTYEETVKKFIEKLRELIDNPKSGPLTLASIQNEATLKRVMEAKNLGGSLLMEPAPIKNDEFTDAKVFSPVVIEASAADIHLYEKELFGPITIIVKTKNTEQSLQLASGLALNHGAITCAAYTTDNETEKRIIDAMERTFTPVTLNLTGPIWVNQHAAFSDFHVTGGNPAGNATFTNPEFVVKRFVWVGHRKMKE